MGLLYLFSYMFRASLAHPQEVLNKRHFVYCVRVMSVSCTRIEMSGVKLREREYLEDLGVVELPHGVNPTTSDSCSAIDS
jgi:hypothetical protein